MAVIGALIWTATITLTNSQIITLPTVPITIVAAPGDGRFLIPICTVFKKSFIGAYSNETGFCAAYLQYSDTTQATTLVLGTAFAAADSFCFAVSIGVTVPDQTATFIGVLGYSQPSNNSPLQVAAATDNGLNFGGGNSANSLRVTVWYAVEGL